MGKTLQDKTKVCPSVFLPPAKPAVTCEQQIKDCTAGDQKLMSDALDCQDKLPDCAAGKENDWYVQAGNCGIGLSGLSAACKTSWK